MIGPEPLLRGNHEPGYMTDDFIPNSFATSFRVGTSGKAESLYPLKTPRILSLPAWTWAMQASMAIPAAITWPPNRAAISLGSPAKGTWVNFNPFPIHPCHRHIGHGAEPGISTVNFPGFSFAKVSISFKVLNGLSAGTTMKCVNIP